MWPASNPKTPENVGLKGSQQAWTYPLCNLQKFDSERAEDGRSERDNFQDVEVDVGLDWGLVW
jgi:hypothetical protein